MNTVAFALLVMISLTACQTNRDPDTTAQLFNSGKYEASNVSFVGNCPGASLGDIAARSYDINVYGSAAFGVTYFQNIFVTAGKLASTTQGAYVHAGKFSHTIDGKSLLITNAVRHEDGWCDVIFTIDGVMK